MPRRELSVQQAADPPVGRRRLGFRELLAAFIAIVIVGCGSDVAPPAELSKAPWLDPKVQAEGLKNSDGRVRALAAHHLGNIGAPAAAAIPTLEKLAQSDPDPKVRAQAQEALEKIRASGGH